MLLAATGGSDRHALVIEHQLRPLFAFFGAHILPVSLYAVNADFETSGAISPTIQPRIQRAVDQVTALLGPERAIATRAWYEASPDAARRKALSPLWEEGLGEECLT